MGDYVPIAKKAEAEVQAADSFRKRRPVWFWLGIVLLAAYVGFPIFTHFRSSKLEGEIQDLRTDKSQLQRRVAEQQGVITDVKAERNKAQSELAPWILLAKSTFSNAPPDKRLDLLLEKVEPLTKVLERIDALTNSPLPNIEIWADGLLLTNGPYKLPVDSNGVGSVSFILKNLGDASAENVSLSVSSVTNIKLSGWDWKTTPLFPGESPRTYVFTELSRPINPKAMFAVSTLRISNDGRLGPFEPLTLFVSSSRSRMEIQLMCLALPGEGKLTPATFFVQTNLLVILPADFRQ